MGGSLMGSATISELTDLLVDLERAGVQELLPCGDQIRYRSRAALPAELLERLKIHKVDLLAALPPVDPVDADTTPLFPVIPEVVSASAGVAEPREDFETIDPNQVPTCPKCGSKEAWQTISERWRCLRCDPPKTPRGQRPR
jgi:hypothetical protein